MTSVEIWSISMAGIVVGCLIIGGMIGFGMGYRDAVQDILLSDDVLDSEEIS